ncbi:MAG: TonB-dependent receptor plug domain-containing protein, partial [Bacteroidales bacterium]|nr:TonB-dependent receptor plug domain-containing protein [Bacteroidales bacterium]
MKKNVRILCTLLLLAMPLFADAQNISVNGTVKDVHGVPVTGVSVVQVGNTANSAVTDLDGKYDISVPENSTLDFIFLGFRTQSIAVSGRQVIDVVLEEDAVLLEETVVIGYGIQKKSDLTGSVASIKESDLSNRSSVSAVEALQGKAAGVQIVNASGAPGSEPSIQIRGYSSNSSTTPLIIVDGLKVDNMNYLDPESISSVEVLKDAASAAIYGIEAGNGVILVTTKSGKNSEKGRVFYNFMSSTQ